MKITEIILFINIFIIFVLFSIGFSITRNIIDITKEIAMIDAKQNQIILLLSKDYPNFDYSNKIKRKKHKMEKNKK